MSVFLVLVIASACMAGGKGSKKDVNRVNEWNPRVIEEKVADPKPVKIIKQTDVIREKYIKPAPYQGLSVGFHGAIPSISYDFGLIDLEGGYTSVAGDQVGLLKAGFKFWEAEDKYASIKLGGSCFIGGVPEYGIFIEAEQYISEYSSILGAIYPARSGGQDNFCEGIIGARLHI